MRENKPPRTSEYIEKKEKEERAYALYFCEGKFKEIEVEKAIT